MGSLTKFSTIVKEVVRYLIVESNSKVLVGIEDNSVGTAIVENLENDTAFNFEPYLYGDSKDLYKKGINTNSKTKDQMVSVFYDYVNSDAELIRSNQLIDQLSIIEKRSNGSVAAKSGQHDDLFMASCLCAYMKKQTILDSKYNTTSVQRQEELDVEERMVSDVIFGDRINVYENMDVFSSERELLKSMDDINDFTF